MNPKDVERLVMAILEFVDSKLDDKDYPVADGVLKLAKSVVPMLLIMLLHDGPQAGEMNDAQFAAISEILANFDAGQA